MLLRIMVEVYMIKFFVSSLQNAITIYVSNPHKYIEYEDTKYIFHQFSVLYPVTKLSWTILGRPSSDPD